MHPIVFTLELGALGVRVAAIAAALILTLVYWRESVKKRGAEGRRTTWIETGLFFAIALAAAIVLPARLTLPEPLSIDLRSWGMAGAFGMFFGLWVQQRLAAQLGVDKERIFDMWLIGGAIGLGLGRVIHVLVNFEVYQAEPIRALAFWDGGLVFLGALIGYVGFAAFIVRRHRLPLGTFDALAVGLPAGHVFGRLGCLLAGCCFGDPTDLPWGVSFPEGSIAHYALQTRGLIPAGATATMPLHPTQAYEMATEAAIAVGLYALWRRPHPTGSIACGYLIAYSAVRILLELFRQDRERGYLFRVPTEAPLLLSESQFLSLVLIVAAGLVLVWLKRHPSADGERALPDGGRP